MDFVGNFINNDTSNMGIAPCASRSGSINFVKKF